jgi:hypothetical protein
MAVVHNGDGLDKDSADQVGKAQVPQHQVVCHAQQRLFLSESRAFQLKIFTQKNFVEGWKRRMI